MDRLAFLNHCLLQKGKPYLWSAKGPDAFDCSGLVTFAIHEAGGPDWRAFHNAQKLWNELPAVAKPLPGDLAFYGSGPDHVTHVMVCVGDGTVFGATGGNSHTTTIEAAHASGARVRSRTSPDYRPDCLGFRSIEPLCQEKKP